MLQRQQEITRPPRSPQPPSATSKTPQSGLEIRAEVQRECGCSRRDSGRGYRARTSLDRTIDTPRRLGGRSCAVEHSDRASVAIETRPASSPSTESQTRTSLGPGQPARCVMIRRGWRRALGYGLRMWQTSSIPQSAGSSCELRSRRSISSARSCSNSLMRSAASSSLSWSNRSTC